MSISHDWSSTDMTPQLMTAVGHVVLRWSLLENKLIWTASFIAWPRGKTVPSKVGEILRMLKNEADNLYPKHPDMPVKLSSFCDRLLELQGARNDICHGVPGRIKISGRAFTGLMIPAQGRKEARYREISVEQIDEVARHIIQAEKTFDKWSDELYRAEQRRSRTQQENHNGQMMFTADIFPEPDSTL